MTQSNNNKFLSPIVFYQLFDVEAMQGDEFHLGKHLSEKIIAHQQKCTEIISSCGQYKFSELLVRNYNTM